VTGLTSPAAVLALQRSAGNQAVTAMLQRSGEKTPVTGPGDLGHAGGQPQTSGTTTVSPAGGNSVKIVSPDVKFEGSAWVKEGKTLEGTAYLGWIQNLASSDRAAVYRRGGVPDGEITSEEHEGRSKRWDAVNDPGAEAKGEMKPHEGVFPPFYWQPGSISDENTADQPAKTDPRAHDRPEFSMPAKKDAGRLTQFKGRDNFKLGLAVKKGDAVHMLAASDWSVPWDAEVDANLNGAGKAVESREVQDALRDGPDASLTDWSLRPDSGDVFEGFATPAEAMKRSPGELLGWIFKAREHDQVSYRNICAALDAKAPGVAINVHCDTTHGNWGSDVLSASVFRDGAHVRTEGGIRLNNGGDHALHLSFADVFGAAANLAPSTTIKVELSVGADSHTAAGSVPFPFKATSALAPGDGKYAIGVAL
jgi:hypothetical protein